MADEFECVSVVDRCDARWLNDYRLFNDLGLDQSSPSYLAGDSLVIHTLERVWFDWQVVRADI